MRRAWVPGIILVRRTPTNNVTPGRCPVTSAEELTPCISVSRLRKGHLRELPSLDSAPCICITQGHQRTHEHHAPCHQEAPRAPCSCCPAIRHWCVACMGAQACCPLRAPTTPCMRALRLRNVGTLSRPRGPATMPSVIASRPVGRRLASPRPPSAAAPRHMSAAQAAAGRRHAGRAGAAKPKLCMHMRAAGTRHAPPGARAAQV